MIYGVNIVVESVLMIGGVTTVVLLLLGFVLVKASGSKAYLPYLPGIIVFIVGALMAFSTTIMGKIELLGAGLGGWGIAFMFSAAIGFIITAIVDTYSSPVAN